jgi:L-asparaginase/beta-aspartyl-peptidase (threonine type)
LSGAPVALALHGGAGRRSKADYGSEQTFMAQLAEQLWRALADGRPALDVVCDGAAALEACGLFMAGRGARPGSSGLYELDAALMDGPTRRGGAVAALQGFESPIAAARAVMERTSHVLMAGQGAAALADAQGLRRIVDEAEWYNGAFVPESEDEGHGTVGCVALDAQGRLAAATSTAGTQGKLWGRVGDSPLIGSGTWADDHLAISCTGLGEAFIRCAASAQAALRMRLAGQDIETACAAVLDEVRALGGQGGLIAVDRMGQITTPFNAQFMAFGIVGPDGVVRAEA